MINILEKKKFDKLKDISLGEEFNYNSQKIWLKIFINNGKLSDISYKVKACLFSQFSIEFISRNFYNQKIGTINIKVSKLKEIENNVKFFFPEEIKEFEILKDAFLNKEKRNKFYSILNFFNKIIEKGK